MAWTNPQRPTFFPKRYKKLKNKRKKFKLMKNLKWLCY